MKKPILLFLFIPLFSEGRAYYPQEMADLAETRAPLIRMQLEGKSAATSQVGQSRLLANPVFALQAGSVRSGDQSGGVTDLTLNQPIPWPGKRFAAINSAKIMEKISDVDVEEAKLLVHHSVTLLSVEEAILFELEKHHAERKARFSTIQRFLSSRPMASPRQIVERDLIENQIRLVEGQMYEIETKRISLLNQLQALTGESDIEVKLNWRVLAGLPPKEAFEKDLVNSTAYRRSERMNDLAQNKIEEARYQARPDIVVGVNYRQENVAPTNHFYHANLAIVIPILDRGQHSVEVARAQLRREEANKKLVEISNYNQLGISYQSLVAAFRSTQLFKLSELPKVERRFLNTEDAFKKGRIDVTTFLQADFQIHESIDLAYYSYMKFYTALSEVKLLTGQKLEMP